jgi:hypothetical protein
VSSGEQQRNRVDTGHQCAHRRIPPRERHAELGAKNTADLVRKVLGDKRHTKFSSRRTRDRLLMFVKAEGATSTCAASWSFPLSMFCVSALAPVIFDRLRSSKHPARISEYRTAWIS